MSDRVEHKLICCKCVREPFLSQTIEKDGQQGDCSYCEQVMPCIAVEELADQIETAFANHLVRTADQPDFWQERALADKESDYVWEREGQPVFEAIQEFTQIPREAAADVLEILSDRHDDLESAQMGEETEFSSESHYAETMANAVEWHEDWNRFERSLMTEARFFSRSAAEFLSRIFGHIDTLKAVPHRPVVVLAGPGRKVTHLYRARVFQTDAKLLEALRRPDKHLGSPPPRLAGAGRMNAQGIAVFYGATSTATSLAEVRPPVGSMVAVARFEIVRQLSLLDLSALTDVVEFGSIFDPNTKKRVERVAFLRTLGERMTRPVMPDDEALHYVVTQAVADFLATENEPRLDGIIFGSVQAKVGRNVVLFHNAARVEELQFPKGTEIKADSGYYTDDGWETHYTVSEAVPASQARAAPEPIDDQVVVESQLYGAFDSADDCREVSLRILMESIAVHHVKSVRIDSRRFAVRRDRHESRLRHRKVSPGSWN